MPSIKLLCPADLQGLVSMKEAIDVIEQGYREAFGFPIIGAPRRRVHSPDGVRISNFPGGIQGLGVIGSLTRAERLVHENDTQIYAHREHPVYVLNDSHTGELMGIMIGEINEKTLGYTSLMALRTAATSGVGFRHMPREDASTVGLFGTKGQALNHLLALKVERPIKRVRVYSRDPENRRRFAEAASKILELDIVPVETPKEAVKGVDIVVSATNSSVPVFEGAWLEEGQHVTSIIGSNSALVKGGWLKSPRRENDDETIVRADRLVVNYIESVIQDEQADIHEPIEKGLITWEDVHELGEMLNGKYAPRENAAEITLHKNQIGLGIADLAVAKLAFDRACALQRGSTIELPSPGFDRRFLE